MTAYEEHNKRLRDKLRNTNYRGTLMDIKTNTRRGDKWEQNYGGRDTGNVNTRITETFMK